MKKRNQKYFPEPEEPCSHGTCHLFKATNTSPGGRTMDGWWGPWGSRLDPVPGQRTQDRGHEGWSQSACPRVGHGLRIIVTVTRGNSADLLGEKQGQRGCWKAGVGAEKPLMESPRAGLHSQLPGLLCLCGAPRFSGYIPSQVRTHCPVIPKSPSGSSAPSTSTTPAPGS